MQWEFKVILSDTAVNLDDADRLYARCDDSTLITETGVTFLEFDRTADSLEEAIRSALADIRAAGFAVDRVELDRDALATVAGGAC